MLVGFDEEFFVGVKSVTPPAYQWLFEGGVLAGETIAVLEIEAAQGGDAGDYSVIVANHGSVTGADWNEVGPNTTSTAEPVGGLVDDQGAETGITLSWTAAT